MNKPSFDHSLAALYPDVAKEWHPTKNGGLTPKGVYPKTATQAWWVCPNGHEPYQALISNRTNRGSGCRECQYEKLRTLETINLTCPRGHHYTITNKTKNKNCTICREEEAKSKKRERQFKSSILTTHRELVKEWDYTRNKEVDLVKIKPNSHYKVSWICKNNPEHRWKTRVSVRTAGHGCPFCSKGLYRGIGLARKPKSKKNKGNENE